jgi:VirE N-terminal domain
MEKSIMNYPLVAYFGNNRERTPRKLISLSEALMEIKNCTAHIKIDACRQFIIDGERGKYDALKDTLPAFTPCGTFKPTRKIKNLDNYSFFIVLDIDKLSLDKVQEMKNKICELPHTFSCFISPSGTGLKVLVRTSTAATQHKLAYDQIKEIYERKLQITIDKSGSDVSRLCYTSCDAAIFINETATIFNLITQPVMQNQPIKTTNISTVQNPIDNFQKCVQLTEKSFLYIDGSRNNFVHLLACNCNRIGISEADATSQIKFSYNYIDEEVSKTIDSAYKNNAHEFGKGQTLQSLQTLQEPKPEEDFLKSTPTIPAELFAKLPTILMQNR